LPLRCWRWCCEGPRRRCDVPRSSGIATCRAVAATAAAVAVVAMAAGARRVPAPARQIARAPAGGGCRRVAGS
jgi:hypothetical protein